jgi:hypothetical protein
LPLGRAEIDVRIRQFYERVRAGFERCTDFDARRHFLVDRIERVTSCSSAAFPMTLGEVMQEASAFAIVQHRDHI